MRGAACRRPKPRASLDFLAKKKQFRRQAPSEAPAADAPIAIQSSPTPLQYALLALTALFLLGLFSTEVADTDFWWHLKLGEFVLDTGSLPAPDPFAYTTHLGEESYPGEEDVRYFNLTHEWLSQAFWYLVYAAGGFALLSLWKGFLLTLTCALAGFLAWRSTRNVTVGCLASLAGAPVLLMFASDRPALLTFALVPIFVTVLELWHDDGSNRWLWILPPLSLVWANSHGGFFMGWVVLGCYAVEALDSPRRKSLWIAVAASILASGLNPSGFGIIGILAGYRQSFLTQTLIEWSRPPLWGPPYIFQLLLYAAAVVLLLRWRHLRIAHGLLFVAFGAASLLAFRNLPLIAFTAPWLLAVYGWPLLEPKLPAVNERVSAGVTAGILLALLSLLGSQGSLFQLRAAEWKFPAEAARFIEEQALPGRMFNTYEYGGFLIWALGPERQTFIDGRALNESVYLDYRALLYGAEDPAQAKALRRRLFDQYDVSYVVMNGFEYVSGVVYPLILDLGAPDEQDWKLIYSDSKAVIFARNSAANTSLIAEHEMPKSGVTEHLDSSCRLYIENSPDLPSCARTLGFLYLRAGDAARGRDALQLYLSHWPYGDPEAEQALRSLGP